MSSPIGPDTYLAKLHTKFHARRAKLEWKQYFSAFGRMKIPSIDMLMDRNFLKKKTGEIKHEPAASSGALISINILEACFQDLKLGHDSNANCGYELLMEPANRGAIRGLENDNRRGQPTWRAFVSPTVPACLVQPLHRVEYVLRDELCGLAHVSWQAD